MYYNRNVKQEMNVPNTFVNKGWKKNVHIYQAEMEKESTTSIPFYPDMKTFKGIFKLGNVKCEEAFFLLN